MVSLWSTQEKATAPAQSDGSKTGKCCLAVWRAVTCLLKSRFSQWNLPARYNTQAVFNHGLLCSRVRVPATLLGWQQHWDMRMVSDFRDAGIMPKSAPPLVWVDINYIIVSVLPLPAPLVSTYHLKATWVNALYRISGWCWLWDDEKESNIFNLTTWALKNSIMGIISTSFSAAEKAG